ncbi:MAG: isopentenyl phosphate kinase [Candidatus Methanofastidiosia archaeon]|jgi:isopentenyl phosphate kinase
MIVIKAGGSAITDKKKDFTPRVTVIERIAQQISHIKEDIIIVHGGGSYGHPLASEFSLHKGFSNINQLPGVSQTRYSMTQLNQIFLSFFIMNKIPAVAVQPSACFVCTNKRISHSFLDPVKKLLELQCIPVLYGDIVLDTEIGFCILSGDQIISYITEQFDIEKVIFGLEIQGLYTADPQKEGAALITDITFDELDSVSGEETGDVTKGMKGKLEEIKRMGEKGIEVYLIDITKEDTLLKAVKGESVGTRIR